MRGFPLPTTCFHFFDVALACAILAGHFLFVGHRLLIDCLSWSGSSEFCLSSFISDVFRDFGFVVRICEYFVPLCRLCLLARP